MSRIRHKFVVFACGLIAANFVQNCYATQIHNVNLSYQSSKFTSKTGSSASSRIQLTQNDENNSTGQAELAPSVAVKKQTEVWLAPRDYISYPGYPGTPNFMQLFVPGAPWTSSAQDTQVFQLNELFIQNATANDLKTIFANLKQRHIAVAMEAGMLTDYNMCMAHIEGYRCTTIGHTLQRIQASGGTVDYISMDEPLLFGHLTPISGVVLKPINTVAAMVAVNVLAARQIFPNIKIGTTEVLPGTMGPADYIQELEQFAIAYGQDTGKPLDFLHLDVSWTNDGWQPQLNELIIATNAVNMPLGIIYNGDWNDTAADVWIAHAQANYTTVEESEQLIPGQAIFQTWNPVPNSVLPETQANTMTNLITCYTKFEKTIGKSVMVNP